MRRPLLMIALFLVTFTLPATSFADDCPDWSSVQDKKTGKTYYYNKQTKKTTWTNPCAPCAPWLSITDGASNKTYYHNRSTKTSTWTRPPGCFVLSPQAAAEQAAPKAPKTPCPWAQTKDGSGKTYYYHKQTRQTSWDRPACLGT